MNSISDLVFWLGILGGLLLLSAFSSGAETALFSMTSDRMQRLHEHRRVRSLLRILEGQPEELLTAILLGNLFVNILFFCSGSALSSRLAAGYGGWVEALGALVILFSVILFGEIVPKAVGVAYPQRIVLLSAMPLEAWFRITSPARRAIRLLLRSFKRSSARAAERPALTQVELKELLDAVREEPGFGSQEREILEDIIILPDVRVREIMTPRPKMARRSVTSTRAELLREARRLNSSRVFVYKEREDNVLGYIPTSDILLSGKRVPASAIRSTVYFPETCRVDGVLRDFLSKQLEVAVVVDEYGGVAGVVTVEDIFSEFVGELEPGAEEPVEQIDADTYRLSGQLSVRAWRELFVGVLPEQETSGLAFDTLGGFVISLLGRLPLAGDEVRVRNLRLRVESVRRGLVLRVLLVLDRTEDAR